MKNKIGEREEEKSLEMLRNPHSWPLGMVLPMKKPGMMAFEPGGTAVVLLGPGEKLFILRGENIFRVIVGCAGKMDEVMIEEVTAEEIIKEGWIVD